MSTKKKNILNGGETNVVINADATVTKSPKNKDKSHTTMWLGKQIHAKKITDQLLAEPVSEKYIVPRSLGINPTVPSIQEQRVTGLPLLPEFLKKLTQKDKDIIHIGLATFLQDMHKLYPKRSSDIIFGNESSATQFIDKLTADYGFTANQIQLIQSGHSYFMTHYNSADSLVFTHRDLNANNIFYDTSNRKLSIIDFAEAGYSTMAAELEKLRKVGLDAIQISNIYNSLNNSPQDVSKTNSIFRALMTMKKMVSDGNHSGLKEQYQFFAHLMSFESGINAIKKKTLLENQAKIIKTQHDSQDQH